MEFTSDVINTQGERFIAEYLTATETGIHSQGFYQLTYVYGIFALILRPQPPPATALREKYGLIEGRGHAIMSIYAENRDGDGVYTFPRDCPGTWIPTRVRKPALGRVREEYLNEVSLALDAKVPAILESPIGSDPMAEKFKDALLAAWEVRKGD